MSRDSSTINVLHTVRSLRLDGVAKVIVRNLGARTPTGFQHHVCSIKSETALAGEFRAAGVEPIFLDYRGAASIPRTLVRLIRLIRRLDIDVVHANRTLDFALAGVAAKLCGVPVISTLHWLGRLEDHPQDRARMTWIRRRSELKATILLHRLLATRIVTVSHAVKASFASLPGFPIDRAEVIFPGLAAHAPVPQDTVSTLRRELGLQADSPVLLNIGRLDVVKGQRKLVPMMRAVCDRLPTAKLLIAGEGPERATLTAAIAREGLGDRVVLLGARSDVDVLLALCDALVLSSDSEAFPLPLLEAMRAGRPIVTTDVGGVRELVEEGVNGHVVPPDDPAALANAVLQVFTSPGRAEQMGSAGRRLADTRFDLLSSVRRLEALYREVVDANSANDTAPTTAGR